MKRTTIMRQVSPKRKAHKASKEGRAGLAHMRRVKELACVICGKPGPSDAHHIICDRYGTSKSSDFDTIPLCKLCHQDGLMAIHNNKRAWVERNGPDYGFLPLVAEMLR